MSRPSKPLATLILAVSTAAIAIFVTAPANAGTVREEPRASAAARTSAENEGAALSDAESLLSTLQPELPPGATPSPVEPAGDRSLLSRPAQRVGTPDLVDDHAWWTVPGERKAVVAYVAARFRSAGVEMPSYGLGGGPEGSVENEVFDWPPIAEVLGLRELVLEAVQLPDGVTALRADAEVVWTTPRPPSEVIPSGARLLRITVHKGAARPRDRSRALTVVSAKKIDEVVALLNALPAAQPGVRRCPFGFGISVRFVFLARRHAAPLAVADVATTGCEGVSLTIGGRDQPGLAGGVAVIEKIDRVLAAKLDIAPRLPRRRR